MHCYPVLRRGAMRLGAAYYIFQNGLPFNTHRFQKDPSSFTRPQNFSEIAQSVQGLGYRPDEVGIVVRFLAGEKLCLLKIFKNTPETI